MAIKKTIWCDECGAELKSTKAAREHEERNCVPWQKGDRVLFRYYTLEHSGTVDRLGGLVGPGETRVVYVEADEQIAEPDPMNCITGYDFFIPLHDVRKLEEESPVQA